jgi:hypothetical protein
MAGKMTLALYQLWGQGPLRHPNSGAVTITGGRSCGDPDAWEVVALRAFRDARLRRTGIGRALIGAYKRLSPPLARAILRHSILRHLVRRWVVAPVAGLSGGRPSVRKSLISRNDLGEDHAP